MECIKRVLEDYIKIEIDDIKEIEMVVRRRLTKKEFKVLRFECEEGSIDELMERLNIDMKRLDEIKRNIHRKLSSLKGI